jgi:hypothetical protein
MLFQIFGKKCTKGHFITDRALGLLRVLSHCDLALGASGQLRRLVEGSCGSLRALQNWKQNTKADKQSF